MSWVTSSAVLKPDAQIHVPIVNAIDSILLLLLWILDTVRIKWILSTLFIYSLLLNTYTKSVIDINYMVMVACSMFAACAQINVN